MKNSLLRIQYFQRLFCLALFFCCGAGIKAQSTNISFPTAVSTNEINGIIPARDLGDPRLTSYYYTFNGSQGDIFINVSTTNFNGDIEVFIAEGLRSLSKIPMFADSSVNETGRVIYLRKPERLILRVQGRTPDDNPARFSIKFAGSFVAVQSSGEQEELKLPEIITDDLTGIRVNSVGTIIEVKPKPTPEPAQAVAEISKPQVVEETPEKTPEIVINSEEIGKAEEESAIAENSEKNVPEEKPAGRPASPTGRRAAGRTTAARNTTPRKTPPKTPAPKEVPPNPLENVYLKVTMKNGEEIDFPMTEVFRFSMNNGILTVTMKDGKIHRYPILETQRIVIE